MLGKIFHSRIPFLIFVINIGVSGYKIQQKEEITKENETTVKEPLAYLVESGSKFQHKVGKTQKNENIWREIETGKGFKLLFTSQTEEFLNELVTFEKPLPKWLKGALVS